MRVTLGSPTLARQAGRFVWLELNFDSPANRRFLLDHGVAYTPTLLVLDPRNERATASHFGGLTLPQLDEFLDQGARGMREPARSPVDSALARGDAALGAGRLAEAVAAYRRALGLAAAGTRPRERAVAQLTTTLAVSGQDQACVELAATESPRLSRARTFVRVVLAGLGCANQGATAPWAIAGRQQLLPLAAEAVEVQSASRDERYQLYQAIMAAAGARGDSATVHRWGGRWLGELESAVPRNDDDRTALDVARVDVVSILGTPERVIAPLQESERAMPRNYNASLRLAQVELWAGRYQDALAACDRGLEKVDGAIGRTWLLETRAQAWLGRGDSAQARRTLEDATRAANEITTPSNRENNLRRIARMMAAAGGPDR
jgi:tetratricopeptide (TPR) repeat protein